MTTIGDVFRKEQTRDPDGKFGSGGGSGGGGDVNALKGKTRTITVKGKAVEVPENIEDGATKAESTGRSAGARQVSLKDLRVKHGGSSTSSDYAAHPMLPELQAHRKALNAELKRHDKDFDAHGAYSDEAGYSRVSDDIDHVDKLIRQAKGVQKMTTLADVFDPLRKEQTRDADGKFGSGGGGPEKRTVSTKPKKAPHEVYAAKVKARLADPKPLSYRESSTIFSDVHQTGKHGKALGAEAAGELRDAVSAHQARHKAPEYDWKADADRKARYGSKSLAEQQRTEKRGERPMTITDLFAKDGPMTITEFFEKRKPTTIGDVFGVTNAFDDVFQKAAKDPPEPEAEPTIPGSFEHFVAKARAPLINATPCPQRNADPNGDNDDAVHRPTVKATFSDHALVGCPNCAKTWHVPFGIGEDDEVKAGEATERVSRYVDPNEGQGTLPKE